MRILATATSGLLVLMTASLPAYAEPGSLEVHVAPPGPGVAILASTGEITAVREIAAGKRGCLFTGIAPGEYDLTVSAPAHQSVTRTVEIRGGAESEVSVELRQLTRRDYRTRGRIAGYVKDDDGRPVANATLVLLKGDDPVGASRPENASGVYELEWYPPGTYTVAVVADGYKRATYTSLQITAGGTRRLDIELQPE